MLATTITVAAQDAPRGWGGPIALLAAVAVFVALATLLDRLGFGPKGSPSPTPGDTPGVSIKPQVSAVSDTDDTAPDTTGDTSDWWDHPALTGRRMRRVRQVLRTGSAAGVDDEDDQDEEEPADEPDEPGSPEHDIARMDDDGTPYSDIVRYLMKAYDVSEATAKRRIREARTARADTA